MEALLLCCSSIQINHLYHLRGGLFHKERSNGWVFLNTISRTTLLGFFHVLISWYMKGWNPQMVSCVLCWWFSYNTSSTMQTVWAKQGQEYYGHLFCTVFYRCLSCCQKFNGFFCFFFPAVGGGTTAYTDPVMETGLSLDQKNKAFAGIQDYNQGQLISALIPHCR